MQLGTEGGEGFVIANEPPKMLSRLPTVSWVLSHSEAPPALSAYDGVDQMEKLIDAEIEAWQTVSAKLFCKTIRCWVQVNELAVQEVLRMTPRAICSATSCLRGPAVEVCAQAD